jgi:DNA-binding transcriptional ArsR family regulator
MTARRKPDPSVQLFRLPAGDRTLPVVQGREHDCVVALKALGEDTRVRIIGVLINEALDVGEISKRLGISPYNVSKHLRILREAGLLEVKKNGRTRLYAIPDMIRGRAAEGSVLDLGCCHFQFQGAAKDVKHLASPGPARRRSGGRMPRSPRRIKARAAH